MIVGRDACRLGIAPRSLAERKRRKTPKRHGASRPTSQMPEIVGREARRVSRRRYEHTITTAQTSPTDSGLAAVGPTSRLSAHDVLHPTAQIVC